RSDADLDGLRGREVAHGAQRGGEQPEDGEGAADGGDPEGASGGEPGGEAAADEAADGHGAPDDEAHGGVHPAEEVVGADHLSVADLGDVVDDGAVAEGD